MSEGSTEGWKDCRNLRNSWLHLCKQSAACIAPIIFVYLLMDAWTTQQQQQQHKLLPSYTHSSCDKLMKVALLLATAVSVCADTYRHHKSILGPLVSAARAVGGKAKASIPSPACSERGSKEQPQLSKAQSASADASHGSAAGGSQPAVYQSGYRRSRIMVKVPAADSRELPGVSLLDVQTRVHATNPSLHIQHIGVRSGCIIVELDVVEVKTSSEGSSSVSDVSDADWLELLDAQGITPDSSGQRVVSVFINGQVTQLKYNTETKTWVRTSATSTAPQLRPQSLTLDGQVARLSLEGIGLAAEGNKVEAVSAGRPLPCIVVSRSLGAGDQDVVVLEVDLRNAHPGLMQCNVWSRTEPISCIMATLPVLLLPPGCCEAAAQLTRVAAVAEHSTIRDVFLDLGDLLDRTFEHSAHLSDEHLRELAAGTGNLLSWCREAGLVALAQLVADAAGRLGQPMGGGTDGSSADASETATNQSETRGHSADVGAAEVSQPSSPAGDPAAAQPPAAAQHPEPRRIIYSWWAAIQRLDTAPKVGHEELFSSAVPGKAWALFVLLLCFVGFCRSVAGGQGLREAISIGLYALPYAVILALSAAEAAEAADGTRAAPATNSGLDSGGRGAYAAVPATGVRRPGLAWWLSRNSRLCLHVYRALISALIGLGHLPMPLVIKVSLSRPMAGITYPVKMLCMVMEAYDWRAATLCLIFIDTPAVYLLLGNQNPYALKHMITLGWLGTTVQWFMSCLHSVLASSSSRTIRAEQ